MANLRDYFSNQEQALLSSARAAGILQSTTGRGRARERIITDFLNAHLPARVRAERGEVIDSHGRSSGETDIILVDHESNAFRLGGETIVPVEAAVGIVEVKSSLSGQNLEDAIRKIARAKSLLRTQHHGIHRAGHGDERVPIPPRQTNGYVVAYEGPSLTHVIATLTGNPDWYMGDFINMGPEIICILTRGFIYKNDFHFFNPELVNREWIMVATENYPGMEHIVHNVQETVSRYGGLTYDLAAYHHQA